MTKDQKVAAIYALAVPLFIGGYFLSNVSDPGITSNPYFTRAYWGSAGLSMAAGLIGYWIERAERGRDDD